MSPLRTQQIEQTRDALLTAARRLFAERPAADVSAEELASAAGLTRGALYHHFDGKRGLFEAVFGELEQQAAVAIRSAIESGEDTFDRADRGAMAFLDVCADPVYRHVVLQQGPLTLGWEHWRELDQLHLGGIVLDTVIDLVGATQAPDLVAAALYGALTELSFVIARSDDPERARREAAVLHRRLLQGVSER